MNLKSCLNHYITFPINVYSKGVSPKLFRQFTSIDQSARQHLLGVQNDKLRKLLQYAAQHCLYYRKCFAKYGLNCESDDLLLELEKLPPLTKDLIQNNYPALISDDKQQFKRVRTMATGGSTGKPVSVLIDKFDYNMGYLSEQRQHGWIDWAGGDSVYKLWGASSDIGSKFSQALKFLALNERITNIFSFQTADYEKSLDRIRNIRVDHLVGYKSALLELVDLIERSGQPLVGLKDVMVCAEPFFHWERIRMERWFGCKVYSQYGTREVGAIGCECKQQSGYHVHEDQLIVEILSDDNLSSNKGHITITKLNNYLMPLIRYQVGDTGAFEEAPCSCGLPYRRLRSVDGRKTGMIVLQNDEKIPALFFPHTFKDYPWILQYQVEQTDRNLFKLHIKRKEKIWSKQSEDTLTNMIKQYLGKGISIQYQYNGDFTKAPTGKHEFFLSRVV